jgi:hypothetical protein
VDTAAFAGAAGPLAVREEGPFRLLLAADWEPSGAEYPDLRVAPGAVASARGEIWPARDTAYFTWPLPNRDSTGTYEISVLGMPAGPAEPVTLKLWPAGNPDRACVVDARPGAPLSGSLPGGDYLLSILLDTDGDGEWSPGWPAPFTPSERTWQVADTLRIRPRFTTEFTLNLVK